MSETPLTGPRILDYLHEVADALPVGGAQDTILVVGGSLLALHGLRETTVDVDTIRRMSKQLREAVAKVGELHGLSPTWLNDSAAGFAPAAFVESDCTVVLDHAQLRVLGAPLGQVFVMKLYAARSTDLDDLVLIWPHSGFATPEEAVQQYWVAYPHAPDDPHLVEYVRGIADLSA